MNYKYKICHNFKWPSSDTKYNQHHYEMAIEIRIIFFRMKIYLKE